MKFSFRNEIFSLRFLIKQSIMPQYKMKTFITILFILPRVEDEGIPPPSEQLLASPPLLLRFLLTLVAVGSDTDASSML